jgi:hypothetical protein
MAVRYICDRCGESDGVGRFSSYFAVSTPHGTNGLPKFDGELCATCLSQVCAKIIEAFASKRT